MLVRLRTVTKSMTEPRFFILLHGFMRWLVVALAEFSVCGLQV